jgi:hypothetical protein
VPESFKVLVKELQALGLSVDLLKNVSDDEKESASETEEVAAEKPQTEQEAKADK